MQMPQRPWNELLCKEERRIAREQSGVSASCDRLARRQNDRLLFGEETIESGRDRDRLRYGSRAPAKEILLSM